MMIGEPYLFFSERGARIRNEHGEPVPTSGLWNSVYVSLFCGPEWTGNAVSEGANRIDSRVREIMSRTVVTDSTVQDMVREIRRSLAWMEEIGVASDIEVTGSLVNLDRLVFRVSIPRGAEVTFGVRWDSQRIELEEISA